MAEKKSLLEWREICEGWEKSGLKQREYCAQKSINIGSFKTHLYELRIAEKCVSGKVAENKAPAFSKAFVSKENAELPYCTLQFENGEKVIIETESGMTFLKQLLGVK